MRRTRANTMALLQGSAKGLLFFTLPKADADPRCRRLSRAAFFRLVSKSTKFCFFGGVCMKKVVFCALLSGFLSTAALADYANDRAEIENLSNRYMIAVDAGDIETVMATWAEDGVLEWVRGVERGKDAIRKAMSNFGGAAAMHNIPQGATTRQRQHHHILNHVIDVNGNTAKTVAYWFNITNGTPQKDVQLMYFGHYEDELVKQNGKWLFKKRKVFNESQPNRALFYPGLGEKDPRAK
jgi:ketosteroid isomerase-like protein